MDLRLPRIRQDTVREGRGVDELVRQQPAEQDLAFGGATRALRAGAAVGDTEVADGAGADGGEGGRAREARREDDVGVGHVEDMTSRGQAGEDDERPPEDGRPRAAPLQHVSSMHAGNPYV